MKNLPPQTKEILSYLQEGNTLTPIEALTKFGCFRLGARIWDLRNAGYNIEKKMVGDKKKFAQYKLSTGTLQAK